jgi:hypothetical protein
MVSSSHERVVTGEAAQLPEWVQYSIYVIHLLTDCRLCMEVELSARLCDSTLSIQQPIVHARCGFNAYNADLLP